mmetsp:Transcript_65940/g.162287  ORF Transcript_65940/g.162287 Transcript_65940/m.162287 type:complete len:475 (+) Transcript_65940:104-1528(+)
MFSFLASGIKKHYDIGDTLGKGSFATVKVGVPKDGGPHVAIKIIDKKDAQFDKESLEQEIAIMKKVNHPNCIKLHEVFDEKAKMYMVLDLVTGGELFDRIIARGHYSEKDAANLMYDVVVAIGYLHSVGIVHRDLKPENLLYGSNDEKDPFYNVIKVADFGLAKMVNGKNDHTMTTTCGTPGYVAPEVLEQAGGYGPEVDVWSCGVILYILLCGFPPFYDENNAVLFQQIKKGDYSFPSPYWDEVSDSAKDIVSKVLVVDPSKRYTAAECLQHNWILHAGDASAKKLHSSHRAFLLIRKLSIFDNIDPACLQEITQALKAVKIEAGAAVIQAGEVGECMYFINSGTVQVLVNGSEVDRLNTGDFFGEIALTVSKQRTADVKSLGAAGSHGPRNSGPAEPVELFQLARTDFEACMDKYPILKTRLAQIGQARVKRAAVPPDGGTGGAAKAAPAAAGAATSSRAKDADLKMKNLRI